MKVVIMSSFNTANVFGKDIMPFLNKIWVTTAHIQSYNRDFAFHVPCKQQTGPFSPRFTLGQQCPIAKRPPQNHHCHLPQRPDTEEHFSFLMKPGK